MNIPMKLNRLNDSILNYDRVKPSTTFLSNTRPMKKSKDIRILEIENKSVLQKYYSPEVHFIFSRLVFPAFGSSLFYHSFLFRKIKAEKIMNEQQHEIDQQKIRELEDNIKISSMQSMIVGQEKERQRIAVDLHDSLGGLLVPLNCNSTT